MFFYCDSEQGSSCSTPFVSAPSSPGNNNNSSGSSSGSSRSVKNSLYYYFSAPSSPPRTPPPTQDSSSMLDKNHQRGFSFTECDFQFFDPKPKSPNPRQEVLQDPGFYFSAPTSPDRAKNRLKKSGGCCSYWDEMPGTPKMIFGGGENAGSFLNADSDFEFSSSRMSDSDSAVSMQMSSADELFFKGQILPMKVHQQQLTSSDSSGSSNTMASSSSAAGSAPQSPRSGRRGAFSAESTAASADSSPKVRSSLSPMQLLKKYQSMMLMMGKPDSKNSSSSSSSKRSSSSSIPRPARSSSKGRTLRELLHLSSVHKKNRAATAAAAQDGAFSEKSESDAPKSVSDVSKSEADSSEPASDCPKSTAAESKKPHPLQQQQQRSLVGDYSKRFNKQQQQQRRFHSLDLQHGYYGKRLHSGSIVPEAVDFPKLDKRLNYHSRMNPRIPAAGSATGIKILGHDHRSMNPKISSASSSSSSSDFRFANAAAVASTLDHHQQQSRRWESGVYYGGSASANVSPRRKGGPSSGPNGPSSSSVSSLHELHYKSQRAMNSEELRRKTFLPYKQGLLGCLGCATMRIAGLSKSLQPMASTR